MVVDTKHNMARSMIGGIIRSVVDLKVMFQVSSIMEMTANSEYGIHLNITDLIVVRRETKNVTRG